jgi:hypothetical protein
MSKIPAFAEAPALRKASGGGASRRQANVKGISKPKTELFDIETLDLIWHLNFVI